MTVALNDAVNSACGRMMDAVDGRVAELCVAGVLFSDMELRILTCRRDLELWVNGKLDTRFRVRLMVGGSEVHA